MLKNWKILLVLTISLSVIVAFQNCSKIQPIAKTTTSHPTLNNSEMIDPTANASQNQ